MAGKATVGLVSHWPEIKTQWYSLVWPQGLVKGNTHQTSRGLEFPSCGPVYKVQSMAHFYLLFYLCQHG